MGRRSDHNREQLYDMILEAARQIINELGLSAISTRKIAAQIGYTVGTLYHMCPGGLDEILLRVVMGMMDELMDLLKDETSKVENEFIIWKMYETYSNYYKYKGSLCSLAFEHRFEKLVKLPDWYNQKVEEFFSCVSSIISRALPDVTKDESLGLFWSYIHGACTLKQMMERCGLYTESDEYTFSLFAKNSKKEIIIPPDSMSSAA